MAANESTTLSHVLAWVSIQSTNWALKGNQPSFVRKESDLVLPKNWKGALQNSDNPHLTADHVCDDVHVNLPKTKASWWADLGKDDRRPPEHWWPTGAILHHLPIQNSIEPDWSPSSGPTTCSTLQSNAKQESVPLNHFSARWQRPLRRSGGLHQQLNDNYVENAWRQRQFGGWQTMQSNSC